MKCTNTDFATLHVYLDGSKKPKERCTVDTPVHSYGSTETWLPGGRGASVYVHEGEPGDPESSCC